MDWLYDLDGFLEAVAMDIMGMIEYLTTMKEALELYMVLLAVGLGIVALMVFVVIWRQCTILTEIRELRAELKGDGENGEYSRYDPERSGGRSVLFQSGSESSGEQSDLSRVHDYTAPDGGKVD